MADHLQYDKLLGIQSWQYSEYSKTLSFLLSPFSKQIL